MSFSLRTRLVALATLLGLISPQIIGIQAGAAETPTGYNVRPRRISLIEPGTVVDGKAPKGWTHLVLRSHPRVAPDDKSKVNKMTADLTGFLFSAVAARVEQHKVGQETRYRFSDVGVGFGTKVKGEPMIISPDTEAELGANLGFFARQVLSKCFEEQKKGIVICHGDTMAIVDTPVVRLRNGEHRWSIYRYAMLVDPNNGGLATLLWPIDLGDDGRYQSAAAPVEWLPPNKIEDCVMRVDTNQFTLGVPNSKAFAIANMPQGRVRLEFPKDVARLASSQRMTAETAHATEMWLWEMLRRSAQKPK